jgi:hypothetical protein
MLKQADYLVMRIPYHKLKEGKQYPTKAMCYITEELQTVKFNTMTPKKKCNEDRPKPQLDAASLDPNPKSHTQAKGRY